MTKKARSRWFVYLPLLPLLLAMSLLILDTTPQRALRNALFDQYQRLSPRVYQDVPVRIIDIDDESLERSGQWPWPRTRIAELVDKLGAGGAAAIGFDVMFAEPDRTSPIAAVDGWKLQGRLRDSLLQLPDHDQVLAESLARGATVVGFAGERGRVSEQSKRVPLQKARFIHAGTPQTSWLPPFSGAVSSLPILEKAAQGNGALTFVSDLDGIVRRVPLLLRIGETPVSTLTTETLRVAQGIPNVFIKGTPQSTGLAEVKIGDFVVPTTPQGEMWLHYTKRVPERTIPAWKVLEDKLPPGALDGYIFVVGSSAQGLMDLRFGPFGLIPGVEAHTQAIEQIITGHFLERPSWALGAEVMLLMVSGLLVGFVALQARALVSAGVTLLVLGAIFGGIWYAFVGLGLLLDAAMPAVGVLISFLVCSLWHHFSSEREQRWIKDAFSRYVSPNRVNHLVENPDAMELGGLRQECSFIFTDLAGFTTLMEKIDPGQAVSLLNLYLDKMIEIAFRNEGTLDRIVGDAVAIMFSAPVRQEDHRRRALACALEMDKFASDYAKGLQERGIPFGKTRIGVHGGEVIVGNFGGSNIFDYRALGDPVNTAARLESVNKHLGTRICISEFILADCPDTKVRPVGRLVLKGKSKSLGVFEPVVPDGLARAPFEEYVSAYRAMEANESEAAERFAALAAAYPEDPLATLHNDRLQSGETGDLMVMAEK